MTVGASSARWPTFAAGAGVGALVGMALLAGAMYTTDWRGGGAEQPEPSSKRALQEGGQCYSAEVASGIAVRAVDAVAQLHVPRQRVPVVLAAAAAAHG